MQLKNYTIHISLPTLSKKDKTKIRHFIIKALLCIAVCNIIVFAACIDALTTDGLILAAIVDIPSLVYIILFAYANDMLNI